MYSLELIMYVEAHVEDDNGKVVEVIYGDYPSLEGLDAGTRVPVTKINPQGKETKTGEFEILSSKIQPRSGTGTDMIKLRVRKTI